jgi:hypothetical protein
MNKYLIKLASIIISQATIQIKICSPNKFQMISNTDKCLLAASATLQKTYEEHWKDQPEKALGSISNAAKDLMRSMEG